VISGGAGNDTITGGLGNDVILYNAPGLGIDTITDFHGGAGVGDRINVHTVFANLSAVTAVASQQGVDTVITIDGSNKIVLHNFNVGNLAADDFVF
jgi:Ca2+-binding RTX toxin-like protein